MNYENVDTKPSLKTHKLPSVLVCVCGGGGGGGGGQGTFFWRVGGGGGGRVHSAQGTTQFVPIN